MGAATINAQARALLDAIRKARQGQPDKVPPGWMTANQIAAAFRVCPQSARRMIRRTPGVAVKTFRIVSPCGRPLAVPHYAIKGIHD